MIQGNDCVFALKIGETYEAVYCATGFTFNITTNDIETTVNSDGRFRDFAYNTFSYTLTLDGMAKLGSVNSSFDVLIAQGGFITVPYRLIYEEDGAVRTIEGECIVVSSEFRGQADQGLEFSHTFQGKGNFQAFVDGEPNDGGEIPEDGGDGGGGPGTGTGDTCETIINDGILDIIIAPNPPLTYDYRVQLNDIVGTWIFIAWRLDGGLWHYETSQEFMLPHLENGSYMLELAAICENNVFGPIVTKTFDVFNEEPVACDGTIDSWSWDYVANGDGTFTVTFTVNVSSPSETLTKVQYKLDVGYDADLWITRPVVDGVATFSVDLPTLTFNIDLRTVCSNGGFGFSVEDGGEIPEPITCEVSIEILSYYLSYSYNTYNCEAIMTYALTGATIDGVSEIQWFNPSTNAWENIADTTDPVIIIPVVPGTVVNQQFRVACDSTHFGPVWTIPVSVPIKGIQLDSRVINYTTLDEYFHVYVNGVQISEGVVEDNNYTEFNYVGLLNTPVTIKITLTGLPDPAMMYFITRGFEITGLLDPSDEHSVLFEDVMITYGFAIVFWDVADVVTCPTIVDFTGYGMSHDDITNEWVITPIYTVTDNVVPTAAIEYWNGTTWIELGDADSYEPMQFTLPDNTTTEVKLRAKCSEGVFGVESAPIEIITPEFATWTPTNNATVINYSYEDQDVSIYQAGVLIFTATLPPRSTTEFNIAAWDAGEEIKITTSPGYPRIPSDTPDPTETWYTAIWNGDNYVGSYSIDYADTHSVLVNGAGVDLTQGVVFTIQTTDTPVAECSETMSNIQIRYFYTAGLPYWAALFVYEVSDYDNIFSIEVSDGAGSSYSISDSTCYLGKVGFAGENDEVVNREIRLRCNNLFYSEPQPIVFTLPDAATYSPANNSNVFNFGLTDEAYEIKVNGVTVSSGVCPARGLVDFNITSLGSSETVELTLGSFSGAFTQLSNEGGTLFGTPVGLTTTWTGFDLQQGINVSFRP